MYTKTNYLIQWCTCQYRRFRMKNYNQEEVEQLVAKILGQIEKSREGIEDTPKRVAKMFKELFEGYTMDVKTLVNGAIYESGNSAPVYVTDIDFASTCEHHMLPFIGKAHIAYLPDSKIIGLSKIPKLVNMFSRRLQVQERLTQQIADAIMDITEAKGVMVIMTGNHMCATVRGVKQEDMSMKTSYTSGDFPTEYRKEFYHLMNM